MRSTFPGAHAMKVPHSLAPHSRWYPPYGGATVGAKSQGGAKWYAPDATEPELSATAR